VIPVRLQTLLLAPIFQTTPPLKEVAVRVVLVVVHDEKSSNPMMISILLLSRVLKTSVVPLALTILELVLMPTVPVQIQTIPKNPKLKFQVKILLLSSFLLGHLTNPNLLF
jgi:hypothetical protein